MKRLPVLLCVVTVLFSFAACGNNADDRRDESNTIEQIGSEKSSDAFDIETKPESLTAKEYDNMLKIEIIVGNKTFSATLYDNAAAKALTEQLPMTLNMKELNGNEKYYYLENTLPTDSGIPSEIKAGDIMLYGNNCLVLFYESFSTLYSYTPIGHIDNPEGLAESLGSDSVQIAFQKG